MAKETGGIDSGTGKLIEKTLKLEFKELVRERAIKLRSNYNKSGYTNIVNNLGESIEIVKPQKE